MAYTKPHTHVLITTKGHYIELSGCIVDVVKRHLEKMKTFEQPFNYWTMESVTKEELERYKNREPGKLITLEEIRNS